MIASSTDNLEGCEKEECKHKEAFPRFVVDGDPRTCFRSHTEDKPWLIVYLCDLQPVSLVRIQSAEKQIKKKKHQPERGGHLRRYDNTWVHDIIS